MTDAHPTTPTPEASGGGDAAGGAAWKKALAGAAVLLALGAGGWALFAAGPEALGGPTRVDVGGGPIARLDTVALARRIVTASVTGQVVETETEREVLIVDASGAITVRLGADHEVPEGATLLARGRVRGGRAASGGAAPRRLDARAWSVVVGALVPSLAGPDSVSLVPDSSRFGNEQNRSPDALNRSEPGG